MSMIRHQQERNRHLGRFPISQLVWLAAMLWMAGLGSDAFSSIHAVKRRQDSTHVLFQSTLSESEHLQGKMKSGPSRRSTLQTLLLGITFLPFITTTTDAAHAADELKPSIVSPLEVLQRLRKVPVYSIVNGTGIPFMTYDSESASATGYFFLDYSNAQAVLEEARKAAAKEKQKDEHNDISMWDSAKIVALPLDLALRLTVKQVSNTAQNGKSFRSSYQVLPSAEGLEMALRLEKSNNSMRYQQRGRVPLFYVNELLTVTNISAGAGVPQTPAFFSTKDLRLEWNKQFPDQPLLNSRIRVRELSETFRAMIKPGGTDESVRNLIFVPAAESVQVAQSLRQKQKDGEVYQMGNIILTSR